MHLINHIITHNQNLKLDNNSFQSFSSYIKEIQTSKLQCACTLHSMTLHRPIASLFLDPLWKAFLIALSTALGESCHRESHSKMSSIYMWAYAGEIYFPPPASKQFPRIIPHMFLRVGGMLSTAQYICKGRG